MPPSSKKHPADASSAADTTQRPALMQQAGLLPVMVTTAHRGVFFGYADPLDVDSGSSVIKIQHCRMVVYWSAEARGVIGLAVDGPQSGSKVGPAAPRATLRDVTSVMSCTDAAAIAWESEPWGR